VAALAALLAAGPAAAYVRTRDPGTGTELRWPLPTVAWRLNRDWPNASPTCAATGAGDPTLAAIRTSFAAWEQSCADIRLVYGGTSDEIRIGLGGTSENIVVFRKGWCSQNPQAMNDPCMDDPDVDCGGIYNCFEDACLPGDTTCPDWGIVALTSVLYEPDTGRIIDADIEVNGWDGVDSGSVFGSPPRHGWYFTCGEDTKLCASYGEAACRSIDLQNTVTHEAGHFIGLAHAPDSAATMFAKTSAGEIEKRSLSPDDVAGVCAIYPPPSGGGLGCGSGGAAGAISILLAALALRRLI
jgi:hypothetical protein